uniref:CSON003309 protein n=1 Tax=Culicoides sonorensis TaxID=179676 RepID=A0A336LIS6_CULSO
MATTQQYSLKWNNYHTHLAFHFESLRTEEEFTDVSLCCEGKKIKAHKIILSACSTYFRDVFKENPHPHPVIIFKNVKYNDLASIIQFMYNGEVSVIQELLPTFLQTAELLQVRGLTDTNLTESAKNLVAEETRPTETLFLAVPQETNKILTALSSTPIKTVQAQHVPHETYSQIRIEQPPKVIEHVKPPTLVKRVKKATTIQTQQQQIVQHQPATVQTYETLGLDNDGELMETEGEVEFLQSTGMKMEIPDFIDVPSSDAGSKTTTVQENPPPTYIQTSDNVTYQIIDGQVVKRTSVNTGGQATVVQTQESTQDQEIMEGQENESGELAMFSSQDDDKNTSGQGATIATSKHPDTSNNPNSKWTKCQFCKLVITTANLWRHVRTQHTNQPKIQCDKCHKTFKNKYSLREHVRMAHENKQQAGQQSQDQQLTTQVKVEPVTTVTVVQQKDA